MRYWRPVGFYKTSQVNLSRRRVKLEHQALCIVFIYLDADLTLRDTKKRHLHELESVHSCAHPSVIGDTGGWLPIDLH